MNRPWLRLLRLAIQAILRRGGAVPWLVLLLGIAWSALLEPSLLRRSGLPLIETSAHTLALLALLALALGDFMLPSLKDRLALAGILTALLAVGQSILIAVALWGRGQPFGFAMLVEQALRFLLAWWPVAATVSAALRGWRTFAVCFVQVVIGSSVAAVALDADSVLLGLLSLASTLAMEPQDPSGQYANRYSW